MLHTLRTLVTAGMLATLLAPVATAGGMNARLEGPARDGRTYTVRTSQCANPASLRVSAWAEGAVNGERRTVPLELKRTKAPGVFSIQRAWPREGRWLVRLAFADSRAPVTVAELADDGRVRDNSLVWEGDGRHECDTKLAVAVK